MSSLALGVSVRSCPHAGSWYSADPKQLKRELESWMESAANEIAGASSSTSASSTSIIPMAVVSPHAGYSYSGSTAGFAYQALQRAAGKVRRIFILGPSHHYATRSCLLTQFTQFESPIGRLSVDSAINRELMASGLFELADGETDEAEHSIEMQLPFILAAMGNNPFTIIPVIVGSLSNSSESRFGVLFARYLCSAGNFFVISSDFCHWGSRFSYSFYDSRQGEIWQSIEFIDKLGMKCIENQDANEFSVYQRKFGNTICGRHPIAVFLHAMAELKASGSRSADEFQLKFVNYKQSGKCKSKSESSVSYAAGILSEQMKK